MTPPSPMRRAALAATAAAALIGLSACATGTENGEEPENGTQTAEATENGGEADLASRIIATGEAPGEGFVQSVEKGQFQEQVDTLVQAQARKRWEDDACDRAARVETVTNHVADDAEMRIVRYADPEAPDDLERQHVFPVAIVERDLPEFMDRGLYEACGETANLENPEYSIRMIVVDAPEVEGAEGFRVVTDILSTAEDGTPVVQRTVSMHGAAAGVTAVVEYRAVGNDPAGDPVGEDANAMIDALYRIQMEKLAEA